MAEQARIDLGIVQLEGAKAFRAFVEQNPAPWREVKLLDSFFVENGGSLIYEGVNTANGHRIRVAEFLHVNGDKIDQITAMMAELPQP